MAIAQGLSAAAICAGLAIGLAAPASAAPTMNGHYIATATNSAGQSGTDDWYFTPCGDGCASAANSPGGQPFGQARLVNGQWAIDFVSGALCADRSIVPNAQSNHYTWDPNTLAGTQEFTYNVPACGSATGYKQTNSVQFRQAGNTGGSS
ncbi:MAG: hypothetical protein JO191_02730 [Mycobacteriaceae bacterium]|nr:hypothetical protein [Mycobacteriaceae bacterium]